MHAGSDGFQGQIRLARRCWIGGVKGERREPVGFGLLRFVVRESVNPENGSRGDERRGVAAKLARNVHGDGRFLYFQTLQRAGDGAAQHLDIRRPQLLEITETENDHPVITAARSHDVERLVAFGREGGRLDGPADLPLGPGIGASGGRAQFAPLGGEDHENTRTLWRKVGEFDFHETIQCGEGGMT